MASVTEHMVKLQELTKTNLEILQAINNSFYTKKNHLSVKVGDSQFSIPSFINLENKINTLNSNFQNLVHAPESGEAFFNFDGNSRSIEVKSYTTTPNSLILNPVDSFETKQNNIFKDFITPEPFVKFDVHSLPNDITNVVVKKVVPQNEKLKDIFIGTLSDKISTQYSYKDLYKILSQYKSNIDYIEYDSVYQLPIRKNIGSGTYIIEKIINDIVDENLDNYITIKFRSDVQNSNYMSSLKYRVFDETIEKILQIGDQLVTFEGNAKMEITDIHYNTNTLTVKVLHGEYLNLVESTTNDQDKISSLSKINFYSPIDFDNDKYVKVPLEEDQYVFISIAALNDRMNVQSSWGTGVMLNTYRLSGTEGSFEEYYKENVHNIGDILFEMTSMMKNTLTSYSREEYNNFVNLKPIIDTTDLHVVRINNHLNNSSSIKNIRNSYKQKIELQKQLDNIQLKIDNINNELGNISFDDTTGIRSTYMNQLKDLISEKTQLKSSIESITNTIAESSNNSEVPIENAKYRIRGFFDYSNFLSGDKEYLRNHVKGIRVQYRYKTIDQEQGYAVSIKDKFIFSDWIDMKYFDRELIPDYSADGNGYKFKIQDNNDKVNEPSFNQIDIPISQGETVDIRLKMVYDFGAPFVFTTSDWSDIVNIKFPEEFLKDIQIIDIIKENNNEIETNKFHNIIKNEGITSHIDNQLKDQDIIYYHKPENIASGFYTSERRVIPLKDKLTDFDIAISELRDEIIGSSAESLKISIQHSESNIELHPYQLHDIFVASYDSFNLKNNLTDVTQNGLYSVDQKGVVRTSLNISIANNSNHIIKLFSMFPGSRDTQLAKLINKKFDVSNYIPFNKPGLNIDKGVWFTHPEYDGITTSIQGANQFMYFRIKDVNDGASYYEEGEQGISKNILSLEKSYIKYQNNTTNTKTFAYMYPNIEHRYGLCLDSDIKGSYMTLVPGQEILIPIIFEYKVNESENISKIMSFDILPSLYKDPITYTFKVNAKYENNLQDKLVSVNKRFRERMRENVSPKYNSTIN